MTAGRHTLSNCVGHHLMITKGENLANFTVRKQHHSPASMTLILLKVSFHWGHEAFRIPRSLFKGKLSLPELETFNITQSKCAINRNKMS